MLNRVWIRASLVALLLSAFSIGVNAQNTNKVVVITLGGGTGPYAPLSASSPATSDYTIGNPVDNSTATDKVTGLQWQRLDDNVIRDWDAAIAYCQDSDQSGYTDWRLPNIHELISIVDYGTFSPAINASVFVGNDSEFYWSATSGDGDSMRGWVVNFFDGNDGTDIKASEYNVRCVRTSRPKGPWLQDNDNGTVKDLATGRTWQQLEEGIQKTWSAANSYCSDLVLGDKSDWRLPHVKELASIVDYWVSNPAIDDAMFPAINSSFYWSVSSYASESMNAWYVDFYSGNVGDGSKLILFYVRCVR